MKSRINKKTVALDFTARKIKNKLNRLPLLFHKKSLSKKLSLLSQRSGKKKKFIQK